MDIITESSEKDFPCEGPLLIRHGYLFLEAWCVRHPPGAMVPEAPNLMCFLLWVV